MGTEKQRAKPEPEKYYSYPQTLAILERRLGATDREIAAWVFFDSSRGGIAAYCHVHEFAEAPRAWLLPSLAIDRSDKDPEEPDYLRALEGLFFLRGDVDNFCPTERYISFDALKARWSDKNLFQSTRRAAWAIQDRIYQSRLMDFVPGWGFSKLTSPEFESGPPAEWAMFSLKFVKDIEAEDFAEADNLPDGCMQERCAMKLFYSIDELASIIGEGKYDTAHALKVAGVLMTYRGEPADLSRWTGGVSRRGNSFFVIKDYYDVPSPSAVLVLADSLPASWIRKIELSEAESSGVLLEDATETGAARPDAQSFSGTPEGDELTAMEETGEPPGKMPNVAVGKLAIKAAWKIECETNRPALSEAVITLLQQWADAGDESEFLLASEKPKHGVKWRTKAGKDKLYDVEACGKTLKKWMKSRA